MAQCDRPGCMNRVHFFCQCRNRVWCSAECRDEDFFKNHRVVCGKERAKAAVIRSTSSHQASPSLGSRSPTVEREWTASQRINMQNLEDVLKLYRVKHHPRRDREDWARYVSTQEQKSQYYVWKKHHYSEAQWRRELERREFHTPDPAQMHPLGIKFVTSIIAFGLDRFLFEFCIL